MIDVCLCISTGLRGGILGLFCIGIWDPVFLNCDMDMICDHYIRVPHVNLLTNFLSGCQFSMSDAALVLRRSRSALTPCIDDLPSS